MLTEIETHYKYGLFRIRNVVPVARSQQVFLCKGKTNPHTVLEYLFCCLSDSGFFPAELQGMFYGQETLAQFGGRDC